MKEWGFPPPPFRAVCSTSGNFLIISVYEEFALPCGSVSRMVFPPSLKNSGSDVSDVETAKAFAEDNALAAL